MEYDCMKGSRAHVPFLFLSHLQMKACMEALATMHMHMETLAALCG